MGETGLAINNVKVHLELNKNCIEHLTQVLETKKGKWYNNFFVYKSGEKKPTFIIFPKRGFVNVTGIKSFAEIPLLIPLFCEIFHVEERDITSGVTVDNISAAGNFRRRVDLVQLQQHVNKKGEKKYFTVHFDRNFFPGAFCRTSGFGTLTLFPTGKYVLVGVKCLEHAEKTVQAMIAIISTLSTMNEKESACARTAEKFWTNCSLGQMSLQSRHMVSLQTIALTSK